MSRLRQSLLAAAREHGRNLALRNTSARFRTRDVARAISAKTVTAGELVDAFAMALLDNLERLPAKGAGR